MDLKKKYDKNVCLSLLLFFQRGWHLPPVPPSPPGSALVALNTNHRTLTVSDVQIPGKLPWEFSGNIIICINIIHVLTFN